MSKATMNLDWRILVASLRSALCPACGGDKAPRNSFCWPCYRQLSRPLKSALYSRIGEGYEEAFRAALRTLNVDDPQFPESDSNG